ncbi:MAG TPA: transcription antitermination factor NusB [Thermoanaerobaculia bacterium]|nr:transcription antitermination factor NusB [Thermoanaerobaculia bacterium]
MSERERAFLLLRRIERESSYAALVLQHDAERYGESRFIRSLVFTVLRWRSLLDHVTATLAERRVEKLDPAVVEVLRLGIAQIMFMDVAPWAAVSETVDLAGRYAKRARGLVNAILRRASSAGLEAMIPQGFSARDIAIRNSHPEWLITRWMAFYGTERTAAIARANQQLSYPDLLLNTSRSMDDVRARLANIEHAPSPFLDEMVRLHGSVAPLADAIASGWFYPMDEGSAVVAAIAANAANATNPASGDSTLLDLAAAPGGKSLAAVLRSVRVISNDLSIGRLRTLRSSHEAMFGSAARLVVSDVCNPPFRQRAGTVLLDAPCSATGTFRKNPEIKWRLRKKDLDAMASRQKEMLASALALDSDCVVYSTCSLEREENDDVVAATLGRCPGLERADIADYAPPTVRPWIDSGALRLTPDSGTDGFTAFILKRRQL